MIIKRNLRAQMPALKRCNAEATAVSDDLADEDGFDAQIRHQKRRKANDFFPFEALGNLASASIPYLPPQFRLQFGVAEVEAEVSSPSPATPPPPPPPPAEPAIQLPPARPPVVRTSRGRAQVLPAKFNDSVLIDPWKKEKTKAKALDSELDADFEAGELKGKSSGRDFGCKDPNLETLSRDVECYRACRNLSAKKNSTLRSTLTLLHEDRFAADAHFGCFEEERPRNGYNVVAVIGGIERRFVRENGEKRKDYYFPEEFGLGDIVWAKSGKKFPAWPAVVIDPMHQAPEMVLDSCIPGAICVMFFGYSGNGKERV